VMLDIILRNRMFTIDQMYNWGMINTVNGFYKERGAAAIISAIEAVKPAVQAKMDETIAIHSD